MPQRDGPRLEGRDQEIWARYVGGMSQARLAAEFDVSQQRISQVLGEVRATIGDDARVDAALLAQERTDALLAAVWPAAMEGDTRAVLAALRVLERQARAMGTDAVEPVTVTLERRADSEASVIGEAVAEMARSLAELLPADRRDEVFVYAMRLAQWRLLQIGEQDPGARPEPPAGVSVPAAVVEEPDLMADFRKFAEREGFDPDGLDDDQEDDGDDE
jgi:hypothetical protein